MQSSITQCLSQARINWQGYGRKGVWHKNVGMISCHPNELTSSWIVSVDAFIALTRSEQDQKYGRIPTIVRKVQRYNMVSRLMREPAVLQPPCHQLSPGAHQQHGVGAPVTCSMARSGTGLPGFSWIMGR